MPLPISLRDEIVRVICSVEKQYQRTKGLILTEDDLKCLIYSKLRHIYAD